MLAVCVHSRREIEVGTHNISSDNDVNRRRVSAVVPIALKLRSPPQAPRRHAVVIDAVEPQVLAHALDDAVLAVCGRHAGGIQELAAQDTEEPGAGAELEDVLPGDQRRVGEQVRRQVQRALPRPVARVRGAGDQGPRLVQGYGLQGVGGRGAVVGEVCVLPGQRA